MSRNLVLPLLLLCACFSAAAQTQDPQKGEPVAEVSGPHGRLVIIGGGSIPEDVWKAVLKGHDPKEARVCVLPFASELPDTYARAEARFVERGVVEIFQIGSRPSQEELNRLQHADVVWIPGGSQVRFMEAVSQSLVTSINERFRAGATIAGTSAGAAVAARVMIAGNASSERGESGATPVLSRGLGLLPEALVDQHFSERRRLPRLLAAVLEHPDLLGVGIDESTAAIVQGQRISVAGSGTVTILDARSSPLTRVDGKNVTGRNIALHLLASGESFDGMKRPSKR